MRLPISQQRSRASSRRGAALVLFAVLAFAFFAIAGIAIDLGTASLSQQEMQVAVDPAAMEGVRLRDYNVYQHYSDQGRRPKVSNLVRLIFDDDLHPTGGTAGSASGAIQGMLPDDADELQFGAGPTLQVSGQGPGPLAPGGVLGQAQTGPGAATPTWDDPILQGNMEPVVNTVYNAEYGDMVSGTYRPDQSHDEDEHYHREDFAASDSVGSREALGFLVRMRRTTGGNPLDDLPNYSSHGPTIPFIWSLGSLMLPASGSSWDPRRDGITVRATAIAVARPALRASPPPANTSGAPIISENEDGSSMLGLHSFALSLDLWNELNPGSNWSPTVTELIIDGDKLRQGVGGPVRGNLVDPKSVTSVGKARSTITAVNLPTSLRPGFIAIYASVNGTERIIGYGFTDAARVLDPVTQLPTKVKFRQGILAPGGSSTGQVRVWVAANGVSALIGYDSPQLNAADWERVFQLNASLAYGGDNNLPAHAATYDQARIRPGTLLAPALAR